MGLPARLARKVGKAAANKIVNAAAQCKRSPNGKHHIIHESDTENGITTTVFYCKHCGHVDHKMTRNAHR